MGHPDDMDRTIPLDAQTGATPASGPEVTADSGMHLSASAPHDTAMDSKSWVGEAIGGAKAPGTPITGGRYKILSQLGEGGFGIVYLAEQTEPVRRKVALKVLKLAFASPSMLARFEAEQQALAMMDHPGLAKVFDAGTTPDGQPYFAMEYAPGEPLTTFCDKRNLSIRARLTLLAQICDAVHHAHMKAVVHRDLKPGNILVGETDEGMRPKVIDFGIAKAISGQGTDRPTETQFGQFVGTPVYMSPEQSEGGTIDIDIRSDIYSLGVILYELLIGQTPIASETLRKSGLARLHKTILETEADRPSVKLARLPPAERAAVAATRSTDEKTLARQLRRDLDWIDMKCLEKDRVRRYESASALAAELRRYLGGEAVLAGPPGAGYRIEKFVRRHRIAVGAGAVAVVGLVAFAIAMTMLWSSAVLQQNRAQKTLDVLLSSLKSSDVSGEQAAATVTIKDYLYEVERQTESKLADQPDIASDLRGTIGWVMTSLTDYDGAIRNLQPVVAYRREQAASGGSDEKAALAMALYEFGRALYFKDRNAEARDAYAESLALRVECLHPDDLLIPRTMLHLAAIYANLGDLETSSKHADEAIRRFRAGGPDAGEVLARALYSHAGTLAKAQRYDEARKLVDEFIEVTMRSRPAEGANNWMIGRGLGLLAEIELGKGRPDLAVVHQRRAVDLIVPRYGQHHPTVTGARMLLARLLCEVATGSRAPESSATISDAVLLDEALTIARASVDGQLRNGGFPIRLADSLDLISRLTDLKGDRIEAIATVEQMLTVLKEKAPQAAQEIRSAQDRLKLLRQPQTAPTPP
ncbi:MAG: serine/threonine protein kinase [Phycisphaerales bacterium]|nr:serine/threonine protein kinase [Phycisphaerales bacterium]